MRDIQRAGNMAFPVGFWGSCIDKKNLVSSLKRLIQVPGINFVLELRFVGALVWSAIALAEAIM